MVAQPEISTPVAAGKFVLRPACRACGWIFSGNDRPSHCLGGISAGAHWSGSKHWSASTGGLFTRDDSRRLEIGQATDAPDQRNVAWNLERRLDWHNRRNRNVYLCDNDQKPSGSYARS